MMMVQRISFYPIMKGHIQVHANISIALLDFIQSLAMWKFIARVQFAHA